MKQKAILSLILMGLTSLNFIGCINNDKNLNQKDEQQENISTEASKTDEEDITETSKTDQTDITEKDSNLDVKNSEKDKSTNNKEKDKVVKQNNTNTKTTQESKMPSKSKMTQESKTTPKSKDKIVIDVKNVDKNSTFPFGMSKDNVIIKLKELKLEVTGEIEITSREDDPELGNKIVSTDCSSFAFDKNNQLYSIHINSNIPTSLGLKIGDSLEQAEKLYGKNYTKYKVENDFAYEYHFNDHYFIVFINDDKIIHLGVSKYKFHQ